MNKTFKSWKTTLIGLVIIAGLIYSVFWNGSAISFESAISLLIAIGFIASKDSTASHTFDKMAGPGGHPDPDKEEK